MKQSIFQSFAVRAVFVMAGVASLFAFTIPSPGGDSFEVYLNNKMILQQFIFRDHSVKSIDLSGASGKDVLKVIYNHCGRPGTNKVISLRDEHQKVLRQWKYDDAATIAASAMTCPVDEIQAAQKDQKTKPVSLFYSSDLLPEGKVLAVLRADANKASM